MSSPAASSPFSAFREVDPLRSVKTRVRTFDDMSISIKSFESDRKMLQRGNTEIKTFLDLGAPDRSKYAHQEPGVHIWRRSFIAGPPEWWAVGFANLMTKTTAYVKVNRDFRSRYVGIFPIQVCQVSGTKSS
jgi:hypothetical protein